MKFLKILILILCILNTNLLFAAEEDKKNKITKNLRCLICQGQSVYDSDSEFANSLKILVKKIKRRYAGKRNIRIHERQIW